MAALAELTDTISVAADAISTNFELQQLTITLGVAAGAVSSDLQPDNASSAASGTAASTADSAMRFNPG